MTIITLIQTLNLAKNSLAKKAAMATFIMSIIVLANNSRLLSVNTPSFSITLLTLSYFLITVNSNKEKLSPILHSSSGLAPPIKYSSSSALSSLQKLIFSFLSAINYQLSTDLTRPQVLLTVAGIGLFAAFVVIGGFWLSALPDLTLARTLLTTGMAVFGLGVSLQGILPSVAGGVYPLIAGLAEAVFLLLTQPSVLISTVAGVLGTAAIVVIWGMLRGPLSGVLTTLNSPVTTLKGGLKWLSSIIQNSALNTWLSSKMTAQSSPLPAPAIIAPVSSLSTSAPVMPIPVTVVPIAGSPLANTTRSSSGVESLKPGAVFQSTGSPALTPVKVAPPARGGASGPDFFRPDFPDRNIAFFTFLTVAIGLFGMAYVKNKFFQPKPDSDNWLSVENRPLNKHKSPEVKNNDNESQPSIDGILREIGELDNKTIERSYVPGTGKRIEQVVYSEAKERLLDAALNNPAFRNVRLYDIIAPFILSKKT